jgi:hypothetical protein
MTEDIVAPNECTWAAPHTEQLVLFFAIAAPQRTRTAGRELEVGQRQLHNPSGQTDDVEQTTFKKKVYTHLPWTPPSRTIVDLRSIAQLL